MLSIALIGVGFLAGIMAGMLGIGGGTVMVPLLALGFGFAMHESVGTSLAVIIPIAIAGALTHYGFANVNLEAFAIMSVGAIFGAVIGAWIAESIPGELLTKLFGIALLVVGVKMILG